MIVQRALDVWLRKYIPWLFFLTLAVIFVGQGTGVASALRVVKASHGTGPLQRTAIWAWSLLLLVVAAILGVLAARVVAGGFG